MHIVQVLVVVVAEEVVRIQHLLVSSTYTEIFTFP